MEFDHVGVHCQFESCNQKDFLPFRCDLCNKMLCLQHRSVLAHSCHAQDSRDMTSNDCPLCGKSFKFLRSEDPNMAWQTHFTSECSQSGGGSAETKTKCYNASCRNILGPSNTYQCKICHRKVCLSHRNPEDHQCKDGRAAAVEKRLAAISPSAASASVKPPVMTQKAATKKTSNKKNAEDPANTLRGSAQRRMQQTNHLSPPAATFDCPFCMIAMSDADALQQHVHTQHLADSGSAAVPGPSPIAGTNEVCPQCQQRFSSVGDLISHVERMHSQNSTSSSLGDNCIVH